MSFVMKGVKLWAGALSLGGNTTTVAVDNGYDELEKTGIEDITRHFDLGLETLGFSCDGYQVVSQNTILKSMFDAYDGPITLATSATEGVDTFFFRTLISEFNPPQGSVGSLKPFKLKGSPRGGRGLITGKLLANKTAIVADGNGTAFQLPAVASGQRVFVAAHLLAMTGTTPTLILKLQSAAAENFSGTVTDRIVIPTFSATGKAFVELDGPITDTWYRVNYDVSGSGHSSDFVVVAGVK
jgi:hypothetical protein